MIKSPLVDCELITIDRSSPQGNCFCIMAEVTRALKKAGRHDLVSRYKAEAIESDYNHLCSVSKKYVNITFYN